jgi:hypothetical protein
MQAGGKAGSCAGSFGWAIACAGVHSLVVGRAVLSEAANAVAITVVIGGEGAGPQGVFVLGIGQEPVSVAARVEILAPTTKVVVVAAIVERLAGLQAVGLGAPVQPLEDVEEGDPLHGAGGAVVAVGGIAERDLLPLLVGHERAADEEAPGESDPVLALAPAVSAEGQGGDRRTSGPM